ncbi:MAG: glycoside hydrolase family 3 C-terminal domain-containing protein [Spirochaetales bacterium]|nr:glycoside hydrolase family 3 C-terminal domain-containing protein [Spirochaetales bacterium]
MKRSISLVLSMLAVFLFSCSGTVDRSLPYFDDSLSYEERAEDLLSRLTLTEKARLMSNHFTKSYGIPRLGIPKYNWWNEALHGVARAGEATVFPQAIGLASVWDSEHHFKVATAISDEARAKYNEAQRHKNYNIYYGLTFWSPNINLFRDPRWGRGQETYGEDPFLTAELGISFVKGMQGDHPKYNKVDATVKHFAVHSGPEPLRHTFDADCSDKALREFYLYAFERTVKEAKPAAVMGAYNRFRGESCCASNYLFSILRGEWGFGGYIVSDCGAINDIWANHKIVSTAAQASALAVKAGCDLNCGMAYNNLPTAVRLGFINEADIDKSLRRLLFSQMRLGMYDAPGKVPYSAISNDVVDSPANKSLNLDTARKSAVLLKNNGILPFSKEKIKKIAAFGPSADSIDVLVGNYNGTPSAPVTLLAGLQKKCSEKNIELTFAKGFNFIGSNIDKSVLSQAADSDVIIIFCGLSAKLEGEEGDAGVDSDGFYKGDRTTIELPKIQKEFIRAAVATEIPVVLVLTTGSAIALTEEDGSLDAILNMWYPGGEGGTASADILFGDYNPAGRLPITFYKATTDLPDFTNYDLAGRTYRYFKGEALYPFGYGLSYTQFDYSGLKIRRSVENVAVSFSVKNTGKVDGDEVCQVYLKYPQSSDPEQPVRKLIGFKRVAIGSSETFNVEIIIPAKEFVQWNTQSGVFEKLSGEFAIEVSSSSDSARLSESIIF